MAGEVKDLAQETARATEEIARRVESIQGDTTGGVEAIGRISEITSSINDYQLTIASAMEEQTAITNEMPRSVAGAAGGSTEIATNITGVSTAASSTAQALSRTRVAVEELACMAAELIHPQWGGPLRSLSGGLLLERAHQLDRRGWTSPAATGVAAGLESKASARASNGGSSSTRSMFHACVHRPTANAKPGRDLPVVLDAAQPPVAAVLGLLPAAQQRR
ncbi:hypothetical protein [Modestobacter sp. SSW1-42]|uniref:hypothetical protein n=1 Tax=Modestobacter sp. SSW1-42 TaxID=596372 RepID=UPI0039883451